jgi:hypothetical protein
MDNELLVESAIEADLESLTEAAWWDKYKRRSLTREESGRLKVPQAKLDCTVMYFEDKKGEKVGYAAYTHRAATKFYPEPEAIPAEKLEFISSTS